MPRCKQESSSMASVKRCEIRGLVSTQSKRLLTGSPCAGKRSSESSARFAAYLRYSLTTARRLLNLDAVICPLMQAKAHYERNRLFSTTTKSDTMSGRMDFGIWRRNVIGAARRAADREYQERVWFGRGTERDSPDDLICTFMDDLVFANFLRHPMLRQPERIAATRLYEAVQAYAD